MNKQISAIIKYLINKHYNDGHADKKYVSIEIDEEKRFDDGNIKIDAYGKWMKDFCVHTFLAEVWSKSRSNIYIRVGNKELNQYEKYKVCVGENVKLELTEEPYVNDCEYYVSFVFEINKRTLKNKFPVIKKYIKAVADEHKALKIKITGSDEFWKAADNIDKYIKSIGECVSTIMTYETSNSCKELLHHSLDASTNNEAVEKFQELVSQRILDYTEDDLKL